MLNTTLTVERGFVRVKFIDREVDAGLNWPTWSSFWIEKPVSMWLRHNQCPARPECQRRWLHIYQQIPTHLRNASADGTSERHNRVNELHALICCSFIRAARGVTTISLLHRLLYVWWVPWRENLIMQSNFLKANCFDVCSKEEGVYPLHFCFPLFYNEYLNIIVIYLSPLRCWASQRCFQVYGLTSSQSGESRGMWTCTREVCCLACLGEHLLVVVWRVRWHFLVLPLGGWKSQS